MGVCELSALTFQRNATFAMYDGLYSTLFNTQLRSNIDQIRMALNRKPMHVNTHSVYSQNLVKKNELTLEIDLRIKQISEFQS